MGLSSNQFEARKLGSILKNIWNIMSLMLGIIKKNTY